LRILLRFADAAGLVGSVGDVGRGVEKHPLRSPSSAPVAGATRRTRSSVVFERSAVTGDRVCLALIAFHRPGARGGAQVR